MFILTLDSNNPKVVEKCLKELSKKIATCGIGHVNVGGESIQYEYEHLKHKWEYMTDFLYFNPDGNTLKVKE